MFSTYVSLFFTGAKASFLGKSCPIVKVEQNFDLERYWGQWYEIAVDKEVSFEKGSECVNAMYSDDEDGNTRVVNNGYYDKYGWYGVDGAGYQINPERGEGSLFVDFSGKVPDSGSKANYNILSTDYENYSVVYSCSDYFIYRKEELWILGRDYTLGDEYLQVALDVIKDQLPHYDFDNRFKWTLQGEDNCPYEDI